MKKYVFILNRTNNFRFYAPLIDFLNSKKKLVEVLILESKFNLKDKFYLSPLKLNNNLIKKKVFFSSLDELFLYLIKGKIKYIFSLDFISKSKYLNHLKNYSIDKKELDLLLSKWCVISHGMDSFDNIRKHKILFNKKTKFFFTSKYMYQHGLNYLEKFSSKKKIQLLKKIKTFFTGNSYYSKKIFLNKKVNRNALIYLPFPYYPQRYYQKKNFSFQAAFCGNKINFYYYYRNVLAYNFFMSCLKNCISKVKNYFELIKNFKQIEKYYFLENEENIIKAIRVFCDRNNLDFICKPRLKFPYNSSLLKHADKIIYDDESQIYPTKLQNLFHNTKIVVGSLSSTIFETSMANIPYVNISIPDIAFLDKADKFWYNYKSGSYYNYKSVVINYSISELINDFPNKKIEEFNIITNERGEYLEKFCGISDNKNNPVGENIFKVIK